MILYVACIPDEYELPVYVASNPGDMARHIGKSTAYVYKAIVKHQKKNPKNGLKLIKVVCDDDDPEDIT